MAELSLVLIIMLAFGFVCFVGGCITLFIYGIKGIIDYVARVK